MDCIRFLEGMDILNLNMILVPAEARRETR